MGLQISMAIFVLTMTTTQPITLPLAHACGVIMYYCTTGLTLVGKFEYHYLSCIVRFLFA